MKLFVGSNVTDFLSESDLICDATKNLHTGLESVVFQENTIIRTDSTMLNVSILY